MLISLAEDYRKSSSIVLVESLTLIAIALEIALVVVCTVVVDAAYNVALGIAIDLGIALLLDKANNLALFVFDVVRHNFSFSVQGHNVHNPKHRCQDERRSLYFLPVCKQE